MQASTWISVALVLRTYSIGITSSVFGFIKVEGLEIRAIGSWVVTFEKVTIFVIIVFLSCILCCLPFLPWMGCCGCSFVSSFVFSWLSKLLLLSKACNFSSRILSTSGLNQSVAKLRKLAIMTLPSSLQGFRFAVATIVSVPCGNLVSTFGS